MPSTFCHSVNITRVALGRSLTMVCRVRLDLRSSDGSQASKRHVHRHSSRHCVSCRVLTVSCVCSALGQPNDPALGLWQLFLPSTFPFLTQSFAPCLSDSHTKVHLFHGITHHALSSVAHCSPECLSSSVSNVRCRVQFAIHPFIRRFVICASSFSLLSSSADAPPHSSVPFRYLVTFRQSSHLVRSSQRLTFARCSSCLLKAGSDCRSTLASIRRFHCFSTSLPDLLGPDLLAMAPI
jgi:hypothetical protein